MSSHLLKLATRSYSLSHLRGSSPGAPRKVDGLLHCCNEGVTAAGLLLARSAFFVLFLLFSFNSPNSGDNPLNRRLLRRLSLLSTFDVIVPGASTKLVTEFERRTTALVAIVYKNLLIVANVGDSRGVICDSKGNTVPLSFDHKPDQLKERRRIRDAGGFIAYNGVWRVAGILATSRALGDFPLKDRNLVIARPDILTFDLSDLKPKFMILATDGLWDTFNNEDAVAFIKDTYEKDLYKGARSLVLQAFKNGSMDNVTVLVVTFPCSELS
ncbi:protein phosphatase 1L [Trichonephila clavipes]|nr:protein phosphatase 1L [Trichonephila clavipes]